jgi:hypothetical protein
VSTLGTVLLVLALLFVVLALGGFLAIRRRDGEEEHALRAQLEAVNEDLAVAHAADKGWERAALERAAREAFAERSAADVRELHLVQVVDKPGIEDDQAVFRVVTDHGSEYLHLDRHEDRWVAR